MFNVTGRLRTNAKITTIIPKHLILTPVTRHHCICFTNINTSQHGVEYVKTHQILQKYIGDASNGLILSTLDNKVFSRSHPKKLLVRIKNSLELLYNREIIMQIIWD